MSTNVLTGIPLTGIPLAAVPLKAIELGQSEDIELPPFVLRIEKMVESFTDPDLSGTITPLDIITYRYNVRNAGTDPLTSVSLNDGLFGLSSFSCDKPEPVPILNPGEVLSCTATYQATTTDAANGAIINTAVADSNEVGPVEKTISTPVYPVPNYAMTLVKTLQSYEDNDSSGTVTPGDVLTYQYVVENTGDTRITNVTITDPLVGLSPIVCVPPQGSTLQPGEQMIGTATYTVTEADATAGNVTNTGTADSDQVGPVQDGHVETVFPTPAPSATFTKTLQGYQDNDGSGTVTPGDVLTYQYVYENTGNITLTNVQITDSKPGVSALNCTPALGSSRDPGEQMVCTATYTVTAADATAGNVANTGTGDCNELLAIQDGHVEPVFPTPTDSMTLAKTLDSYQDNDGSGNVTPGDVLTYRYIVENTGNTTLTNVQITDPLAGLSVLSCNVSQPATLTPAQTLNCTATYTVVEADATAGNVTNTATADSDQTAPIQDQHVEPVFDGPAPAYTLAKTLDSYQDNDDSLDVSPGDVLTYRYIVENTGNVNLNNVTITDPLVGLSVLSCNVSQPATLTPGQTLNCTATYTATQADADAGQVSNTGTADCDELAPIQDGHTEPVNQPPVYTMTLAKTMPSYQDNDSSGTVTPGDVLTYQYVAENTGDTRIENVTITDPLPGLSAIVCTPPQGSTLQPAETMTGTATYTVTQADATATEITNTGTVDGTQLPSPVQDSHTEPVFPTPVFSITLNKTLQSYEDNDGSLDVTPGDVLTYSYVAENTGNQNLTNVEITDPLVGLSVLSCNLTQPATLTPGQTLNCTATYTVLQSDADAGQVSNTGTVNSDETAPVQDTHVEPVNQPLTPAATFAKTRPSYEDNDSSGNVTPGDVLTYRYLAENTGNTLLTQCQITDPLAGLSALSCNVPQPATLNIGETLDCTATYTVTQNDADNSPLSNTGTFNCNELSAIQDTHNEPVFQPPAPAYTFAKTRPSYEDNDSSGNVTPGDVLTYRYLVTNTGDVDLTNVTIVDPLPGLSALSCNVGQPATLNPAGTLDCTATYTVTQADADNSPLSNTATADCNELSAIQDTHIEPIFQPPTGGSAYYELDLVNPASNGTATRAAGTIYCWGADNTARFVAVTDNTVQPRSGQLIGPKKTVFDAEVYPAYPPWIEGQTLSLGDRVWTTNQDLQATKVLELAIASKTLGGRHEYTPAEWTVIDDYEPWLGILFESEFDQQVANPAAPMSWTFNDDGSGTRNAGSYDLIEGFTETAIIGSNGNADVYLETNDVQAAAGERASVIFLYRKVTGNEYLKMSWTDDGRSQAWLAPDGSLFVDANLYDYRLRFLADGWVYCHLVWNAQQSGPSRLRVWATERGGGAMTIEVKAVNFKRDSASPYMVTPLQGIRPGDGGLQVGAPADWVSAGYLTESETLFSFRSLDFSAYSQDIALFQLDLLPSEATFRRHSGAEEIRTEMSDALPMPYDFDDGAKTYTLNYTGGGAANGEGCAPGRAVTTRNGSALTPQTRATQALLFDSGSAPDFFIMRFFVVWMTRDNFNFNNEFGPGSF